MTDILMHFCIAKLFYILTGRKFTDSFRCSDVAVGDAKQRGCCCLAFTFA